MFRPHVFKREACVIVCRAHHVRTRLREANTLGCLNIARYIVRRGAEPVTCSSGRVLRIRSKTINWADRSRSSTEDTLLQRVISRAAKYIRACGASRVCANFTEIAFGCNSSKLLEISLGSRQLIQSLFLRQRLASFLRKMEETLYL